ncbi:YitT family protein [Arthrobacter sp. NPDC090010]|uniref:membrane protein YczE n=1 Tax=Arthrobacter sp. NPDC090010 TaxID=3363942 RepID=UPI0037FDDD5E
MMFRRISQLLAGLALYGFSIALFIRAGLGTSPWDILHQGVARLSGISTGVVIIVLSFLILLLWIPLRQKPGWGTLANAVLVGLFVDLSMPLIPRVEGLVWQIVFLLAAVLLNAVATACYIAASFGPGARDGLMTGLARRTGWSLRLCRTLIEVTVAAIGWSLGGVLGVGTVAYALCIGPLVQWLMPFFAIPGVRRGGAGVEVPAAERSPSTAP